jgi:hypothetical protein
MSILTQFYLFPKATLRESEGEVVKAVGEMQGELDRLRTRVAELELPAQVPEGKDFMAELAELLSRHKMAICAVPTGDYAKVVFQKHPHMDIGRAPRTDTGRCHITAYDLQGLAAAPQPDGRGDVEAKYHDLLYQVENKIPGESRHDTAKRIIQQAESRTSDAAMKGER